MLGGMFTITYATSFFGLHSGQGAMIIPIVFATLILSMLSCGVINASIEFIAYRPLRSAPRLAPLITAIGVSFIIEDIGLAWKGPNYVTAPDVFPHSKVFSIRGVDYSWNKLIVVAITIPVLLGLLYLVQQTRQGKAMRATAQDKDAARDHGHQRQPDDLVHVPDRRLARRRRRALLLALRARPCASTRASSSA